MKFFVEPHPDETFISVLARYQKQTLSTRRQMFLELFGKPRVSMNLYYVHNLGDFFAKIGKHHMLTVKDIIYNHTLLPLFFNFFDQQKVVRTIQQLANNEPCKILHKKKYRSNDIYYCRECFNEDIKTFGEPYWHRSHNLPGITICTTHNCFLETWRAPIDHVRGAQLYSATRITHNHDVVRNNSDPALLKIASNVVNLLRTSTGIQRKQILTQATESGVVKTGLLSPAFLEQFKKQAYTLSDEIGFYISKVNPNHAVNKIFSGEQPLLFALFQSMVQNPEAFEGIPQIRSIDKQTIPVRKNTRKKGQRGRPRLVRRREELLKEDQYYHRLLINKKSEFLILKTRRRITKTLFLTMPEFKAIQERYMDFPKCRKFFEEECESVYECNKRKFQTALNQGNKLSSGMIDYYKKIGVYS